MNFHIYHVLLFLAGKVFVFVTLAPRNNLMSHTHNIRLIFYLLILFFAGIQVQSRVVFHIKLLFLFIILIHYS